MQRTLSEIINAPEDVVRRELSAFLSSRNAYPREDGSYTVDEVAVRIEIAGNETGASLVQITVSGAGKLARREGISPDAKTEAELKRAKAKANGTFNQFGKLFWTLAALGNGLGVFVGGMIAWRQGGPMAGLIVGGIFLLMAGGAVSNITSADEKVAALEKTFGEAQQRSKAALGEERQRITGEVNELAEAIAGIFKRLQFQHGAATARAGSPAPGSRV